MATITVTFTGTTPLLQHNAQLSDPDNPLVREIKALTSKRTKTEDDRRAIERLEWFAGIYTDPGHTGPVEPTANMRRCLADSGIITRQGKQLEQAITFTGLVVPLHYDGPTNLDQLYDGGNHASRLSVRIKAARTMRVRPSFLPWRVVADAFFMEDVMDYDTLERIVERAGIAIGLGDNRKNGYGRFRGEIARS